MNTRNVEALREVLGTLPDGCLWVRTASTDPVAALAEHLAAHGILAPWSLSPGEQTRIAKGFGGHSIAEGLQWIASGELELADVPSLQVLAQAVVEFKSELAQLRQDIKSGVAQQSEH